MPTQLQCDCFFFVFFSTTADVPQVGCPHPQPPLCLCPAETSVLIHYVPKLKGSALVHMWRTRT